LAFAVVCDGVQGEAVEEVEWREDVLVRGSTLSVVVVAVATQEIGQEQTEEAVEREIVQQGRWER
jgi:hypothetical protein